MLTLAARLLLFSLLSPLLAVSQDQPRLEVQVDLTDAPRHLVHVAERLPVHAGENSFSYPEWIPGQHLPGGPIDNLAGLIFHAGKVDGDQIPWRRDLVDLYSFHVTPPAGVVAIYATFDILEVPSRANTIGTNRMSSHVVMLEPSDVVLYPTGAAVRDLLITPTVHLPHGWRAATAMRVAGDETQLYGSETTFKALSLEQFIDSPILAGDHCRQYAIAPEQHPAHTLDLCSDKVAGLDLQPAFLDNLSALVRQAGLLFGSHHYDHYDFLVAMSPYLTGDSIEHGQSADYVVKSLDFNDPQVANFVSYLLPHEFTHSWCGKYRRPVGMATSQYHTPQQVDLLWVYEGLTEYYGDVLAARAAFRTPKEALDVFDQAAYNVDQPGIIWRSVQDTADASPILRGNDSAYASWRLSQDYYHEGALIWLEADTKIRSLSGGKRSLDDFAARFLGMNPAGMGGDTGPGVITYRFEDVVRALNETQAYDWADFWITRLNALTTKPPTAGLEAAGYRYIDGETMVPGEAAFMEAAHMIEMFHSLGIFVLPDGTLRDVWMRSPAFLAGLGPGDKLKTVNGQPYSPGVLVQAVRAAHTGPGLIVLTAERDDETETFRVDYHGGERYAVLERNDQPDLLTTKILAARK